MNQAEERKRASLCCNEEPGLKRPRFVYLVAGAGLARSLGPRTVGGLVIGASLPCRTVGGNQQPPGCQPGGLWFEKEVADQVDLRLPFFPGARWPTEP